MIIRWQKKQDYHIIRVYQDLVGDWIVSQSWGNCSDQQNACSHKVKTSYQEARLAVRDIRLRLKQEGYRPMPRKETQLGFKFDIYHPSKPKARPPYSTE